MGPQGMGPPPMSPQMLNWQGPGGGDPGWNNFGPAPQPAKTKLSWDVPDPYASANMGKMDGGKGYGKDKDFGKGKDFGKDYGKDFGKDFGKDKGKDFGKGKSKDQGEDRVMGTFTGVIKSFSGTTGFGFIECLALKEQGYHNDVYLHHSQIGSFSVGNHIAFTAYLNKKEQPNAKDL